MKTCPACLHDNHDTASHCEDCGSQLNNSLGSAKTKLSDPAHSTIEQGDVIAQRYRVVSPLGQGGMGAVYLVEEIELEEEYALKLIHPDLVANPEARLRFKSEVSTSRKLQHSAIIRVFDFGLANDQYYFTMEYLTGKSLAELLKERQGRLPPFDLEEIRQVMTPLLKGLAYAHKQTIHRDIKPDNIMVKGEFPDVEVKILDFGIARTMSTSRFTQTNQGLGTPYYMAPEQIEEAHKVDFRADIYSVGVILYEMLTSERIIGFDKPSDLLSLEYKPLDRVVVTALSRSAANRYPNASTMLKELETALDECKQALQERELKKEREEADQRKEAERKRKEQEKRQKTAPLIANLDHAMSHANWQRASELCDKILALDPANQIVAEKSVRIARELTRLKEAEEAKQRAAEEQVRKKKEQEARRHEEEIRQKAAREKQRQEEVRRKAIEEQARQKEAEEKKQRQAEENARQKREDQKQQQQQKSGKASSLGGHGKWYALITSIVLLCTGGYLDLNSREPSFDSSIDASVPTSTYTDPSTGMKFVHVKGGCLEMGDTFGDGDDDEQPVHEVCVDGFYLGKYEVTQG